MSRYLPGEIPCGLKASRLSQQIAAAKKGGYCYEIPCGLKASRLSQQIATAKKGGDCMQ